MHRCRCTENKITLHSNVDFDDSYALDEADFSEQENINKGLRTRSQTFSTFDSSAYKLNKPFADLAIESNRKQKMESVTPEQAPRTPSVVQSTASKDDEVADVQSETGSTSFTTKYAPSSNDERPVPERKVKSLRVFLR